MSSRPKILVVGLELQWHGAARLPRALQEAGFEVGIACRPHALLARTKFRDEFFPLPPKKHGGVILEWLNTLVQSWSPDLILPMDDQTALFLAQSHNRIADKNFSALKSLLRRSLGNPAALHEAASKRLTLEIARGLGIRVPAAKNVAHRRDVLVFAREHQFPVVLKRSFDCGGNGVFVCRNENEICGALKALRWTESFGGRLRLWRERFRGRMMDKSWLPADETITVSQFITGTCAMSAAATVDGEMLGALTAIKEQSHPDEKGPSSVVRFVDHEEMRAMSEKLLQHWKLTGLVGFDFMIDAANHAWLIECNPRPTPIVHLGARAGEDLCLALHRKLISATPPPRAKICNGLVVAHFPQESWRDANSEYLKSAFHDVPWDDPALLQSLKEAVPPSRAKK